MMQNRAAMIFDMDDWKFYCGSGPELFKNVNGRHYEAVVGILKAIRELMNPPQPKKSQPCC